MTMHKILNITLIITVICFSLFITSYAAGVDYQYSAEWFTAILNNSNWRGLDVDGNITRGTYSDSDTDFLQLNGKIFGYNSIGDEPYPVVVNSFRGNDIRTVNNYFPLDVTVLPNQSIELSIVLLFTSTIQNPDDVYTSMSFTYDDVSYAFTGDAYIYDNIVLGDLIYNSSGNIITGLEPNYSSNGKFITYTYTNNTTVSQHISSVNFLVRSPSTSDTFNSLTFGFLANNTSAVVLPSYVENNLIEIGNELKKQTDYLDYLITLLDVILESVDSVGSSVGSISSAASSYQDKVITPTEDDIHKEEEVNEKIEAEKAEQEEILETLDEMNQYVPSDDTLDSMQEYSHIMIDVTETSPSFQSAIGDLFFNSIFLPILLASFGFATASYVFFGKR